MSMPQTAIASIDAAAKERIERIFAAYDKIEKSIREARERRAKAKDDFVNGQLGGSFDPAQSLSLLKTWREQDKNIEDQIEALKELRKILDAVEQDLGRTKPAEMVAVLTAEIDKADQQLSRSSDQQVELSARKAELEKKRAALAGAGDTTVQSPASATPGKRSASS